MQKKRLLPESLGQNMALIVFHVSYSLDSRPPCRRRWHVANRAKWSPPPPNVADSCELTGMTKPTELSSGGGGARAPWHVARHW